MLRPRSASVSDVSNISEDIPVEILPREIRLAEDAEENLPNTLVITVLQARHLKASILRGSLSCYVKLASLGCEYKTSVMTRTNEPKWHETFAFRAVDWTTSVTVSVRDRLPLKMSFLGQVVISSAEIAGLPGMTTQRWFSLREKGAAGATTGAELELKAALVYTRANDPAHLESGTAAAELDYGTADAGILDMLVGQDDETEEEANTRAKAVLRREEQEREAASIIANLQQGDYQVQVHIIEARDLKGENLSGTSDPYCRVEILGKKKATSTKYETLGCVFDEILFFNFPNIGRLELREATIKISIYDKERGILKDNLIGIYQLDCLSVYTQPHHELYRQWIAVYDNVNKKDRGIQGFLLVSVVVLGPGDALRVHDRDAEIEQELEQAAGLTVDSDLQTTPLLLVPPTIELQLQFLVVKVLRAEHLPAMDTGFIGAHGIDAYIQVMFAGNKPCRSSVVTVKGHKNLAPEFYEEIWLPVRVPTFSRQIGLSVWDRDLTSPNELVGVSSCDFLQVLALPKEGDKTVKQPVEIEDSDDEDTTKAVVEESMKEKLEHEEEQQQLLATAPRWYNFYGPPLRGGNSKRKKLLSRHAELGSTYRGRVLMSMVRVESPSEEDGEKMHTIPMTSTDRELSLRNAPKAIKYVLRGALFCGVDLPRGAPSSWTGNTHHVRVSISIGPYVVNFESEEVSKDGNATWEQCLEHHPPLELPADVTQVPDVIVTLSKALGKLSAAGQREDFVSISYARFRAEELFSQGFTAKPQWVVLQEELSRRQTRHALERTQSPGILLLRLGFGRVEMAIRHPWETDGDSDGLFKTFRFPRVHREIRVHIFQARGLEPPTGTARMPSPLVTVRCCGSQKSTTSKSSTPSPLYFESLVFLASVPEADVVFTPDIVLQVVDSARTGAVDNVLGELRLALSSATRSVATAGSPKPRWYNLKRPRSRASASTSLLLAEVAGGSGPVGQVLVSVQYIDHKDPAPPATLRLPASITPKYSEAFIDIVALGVRRLKALSATGIHRPFVEFELVGGYFVDGGNVKRTQTGLLAGITSPLGIAKNANFLDRIVAQVKLPSDTLYAPQLQIRLCDVTLGGLHKVTIASCIVDLADKLPWSSTYRAEISTSGSGSPFRNPSPRKPRLVKRDQSRTARFFKALTGGGTEDNPEEEGDLEAAAQPEAEADMPMDDGVGVGELSLPSVLQSYTSDESDPAVIEQRRREEERRYSAGKSFLVLTHRNTGDQKPVLGSPRSSSRDQEQLRAPYLRGRDWWITQCGGEELEKYFTRPALETYHFLRPVMSRPSLLRFEQVRVQLQAGIFKGRITVKETHNAKADEVQAKQEFLELRRLEDDPQNVVVRVYILRARNLQAKNANGYSDPYLRLKLGRERINDRKNACTNTLQPQFFRMFELETTLPGASQLNISVWDRDLIADKLIGTTTIDLEERWFHREWQQIGDTGDDKEEKLKPIEYRHLYVPHKRSTSQGFLQLWVDILTAQEAPRIEPVDISPPEPKAFEVRVVIWRAENVQDQAQSEINDYFVKAWMESNDNKRNHSESTDTHWRCSNGKPCWNWRLKLRTEFPPRSPEYARLHIQLWDKDILKWNDVLGEAQLDLYKWLRRAYETNRSVSPFLELKNLARQSTLFTESTDQNVHEGESEDGESGEEPDVIVSPREDNALLSKNTKTSKFAKKKPTLTVAQKKLAKEQKEQAEAEAAVNGFLDFVGLGKLPDDAEWIPIYFTDREAAVSMELGRIGISVQIVPWEEAEANPVGKGQTAPNLNPYLPPPVGRMQLSANPLTMFKVLVGPKMCLRISMILCCIGCMMFIAVFGSTFMSTLTYLQSIKARHG